MIRGNLCRRADCHALPLRVYGSGLKAGLPALLFRPRPRFFPTCFLPAATAGAVGLSLPSISFRSPAMATDFRIKETLPELTDRIVQTYSDEHDHPSGALPAAQLRSHRGDPGKPERHHVSRLSPPRKAAPGQRHVSRRRIDRPAARSLTEQIARALRHDAGEAFNADRSKIPISRPWGRPRRCLPRAASRSARCWRWTCRPPTTAIRPAVRWTK